MRFYTKTHRHYCGIDLHAKTMYLCILDRDGQILLQKNLRSCPESFLEGVAPFRDSLVATRRAGKKIGTGGAKIGNVHLEWAFSEAAALFLRNNPEGQKHLRRLAGKHGKGKALSILAAKLGRAVYLILTKERVFEMDRFLAGTA